MTESSSWLNRDEITLRVDDGCVMWCSLAGSPWGQRPRWWGRGAGSPSKLMDSELMAARVSVAELRMFARQHEGNPH